MGAGRAKQSDITLYKMESVRGVSFESITMKDIEEKLIGEDSYTNDEEYKIAESDLRSTNQMWKIKEEMTELSKEIRKEESPKPKEEWTFDDEIRAMAGLKPTVLTEKGMKLQEKYNMLEAEYKPLNEKWERVTDKIRRLDNLASEKQVASYRLQEKADVSTNVKSNYRGFKVAESTVPNIDAMLKSGRAQVVEMSPQTYLKECAYNIFNQSTIEKTIRGLSVSNINKYMSMMWRGVKFDTPYLNYSSKGQEGRHRAVAAMMLGIKRIPVIVIRR